MLIQHDNSPDSSIDVYVKDSSYPDYTITKTAEEQTDCHVSYTYALSEFIDNPVNENRTYLATLLLSKEENTHTIVSYMTYRKKYRTRFVEDRQKTY